jgi:heme-degrading monooxygenase HmoA
MSAHRDVARRGDRDKLEQLAAEQAGISERARQAGVIAHRFYGSEGQIMVVDEWREAEGFQRFFEQEQAAKLETRDDVGGEEPRPRSGYWFLKVKRFGRLAAARSSSEAGGGVKARGGACSSGSGSGSGSASAAGSTSAAGAGSSGRSGSGSG